MTDLQGLVAQTGANDVIYTDPVFPDRPMMLRSACPKGMGPQTRLIFAYHGAARNGGDYRDFWLPFVDEANLLVIAPEFPHETFPGTLLYNFGAVTEEDGTPRPRTSWSYAITGTSSPGCARPGSWRPTATASSAIPPAARWCSG